MTVYTVVWHDLARDELAEIWLKASEREAIAKAANAIDSELSSDPLTKGTQVSAISRELTSPPLQILFRVLTEDRLVQVFSVAEI